MKTSRFDELTDDQKSIYLGPSHLTPRQEREQKRGQKKQTRTNMYVLLEEDLNWTKDNEGNMIPFVNIDYEKR